MKKLKFKPFLVPKVLSGEKVTTWRLFDDKNLVIGDQLTLLDSETEKEFAQAEIVEIREKKLGEVEEADFGGKKIYNNKEEMLVHYRGYYGERTTFDSLVKMITFKLIS